MSISSSTSRCCQFSIKEIKEATNQFDGSKILGQGGEAKVYYAEIYIGSNKTPVAVKYLKENSEEFEREIYTLSKIHHPNLVSLIGYCDESGHKILVYEYMANGSLSDYLKKKSSVSLSWLLRLNICLGAARGLQHLHTETDEFPKGIIHRDVKPGNILVSENWVGKLSDFGMFKLSNAGQDKSLMTTNLKGTSGYYAPEYIKNRRITRKIDVYALGVVLFEVLCRKMPWDREDESYYADEDEDLGFWAQQNVDALIQGEITGDSLAVFTDIIGRSLQANPGRRPTMDGVVLDLQKALECQESVYLAKQLEGSPRNTTSLGISAQPDLDRGNLNHVHRSEEPVLEEPSSSFSEAEDEDPLPAVESLQISGEAFPGRELQASGFSVNGTTSCNFEWVRHKEDGSVNYIDGAKQPNYLVTADDVDTYLAIEVQPMDNRKRKGELVKVFANENRMIKCDPEMHSHIERTLYTGHASYKLSLLYGLVDAVIPPFSQQATLAIKRDGYSIKGSGPSEVVVVTEKFYPSTIVTVPFGNPIEFSIIGSGGVERKLRAEDTITDIRCSRDTVVLILRLFIKKVVAPIKIGGGEYPERAGEPVCQYYLRTGTCKFGASCKFHHPRHAGGSLINVSLNILGYPLRPDEKECSYYLKTGQCKFGITCKFHHILNRYPTVQSPTVPSPEHYGGGGCDCARECKLKYIISLAICFLKGASI